MVSDDKNNIYKNIKVDPSTRKSESSKLTKPSSKFLKVPSSEKVNLYTAICTDCHHEVRVNFEPVKTEPFYCDYCFQNHKDDHLPIHKKN